MKVELTWEDVLELMRLCDQVKTMWQFSERRKDIGKQVFFEEVLRVFNETRE